MGSNEKKVALVVAINYKGSPCELSGCEKDGAAMKAFFESQGYAVSVLSASSGAHPTKSAVVSSLTELCKTRVLLRGPR